LELGTKPSVVKTQLCLASFNTTPPSASGPFSPPIQPLSSFPPYARQAFLRASLPLPTSLVCIETPLLLQQFAQSNDSPLLPPFRKKYLGLDNDASLPLSYCSQLMFAAAFLFLVDEHPVFFLSLRSRSKASVAPLFLFDHIKDNFDACALLTRLEYTPSNHVIFVAGRPPLFFQYWFSWSK